MDDWYPPQIGPSGLLVNTSATADYGYIPRTGTTVSYYNAGYVLALRLRRPARAAGSASRPGGGLDGPDRARRGRIRAGLLGPRGRRLRGRDRRPGRPSGGRERFRHPRRARDRSGRRDRHSHTSKATSGSHTAPRSPTTTSGTATRGATSADLRVYPFISYYELVARYQSGLDDSAITLIRREWGYMLANGPRTTMWETIGPDG